MTESIQGIDPRTGEPTGPAIANTSPQEVRAVAARASEAAPWLAELSYPRRAELLRELATALRKHDDALITLADQETALGRPRLTGELARTAAQLDLFADVLDDGAFCEATVDRPNPNAVPPHTDLRRMLEPLGPVAVFAASNFPFAFSVAGGDTASALAAGCPVVVKAHPSHPGLSARTAEVLTDALARFGAPEGVLAVVFGHAAGTALVTDPAVRAVGFTGSASGGRALFDLAMSRPDPIPFYGELGSINPVVVTPRALKARAATIAEGLAGSFTLGSGQFCTKPGLVFVPENADFAERTAEAARAVDLVPLLNARIRDAYEAGVAALSEIPGVRRIPSAAAPSGTGYQVAAAVLTVDAASFIAHAERLTEECFGPVTLLVTYRDPS